MRFEQLTADRLQQIYRDTVPEVFGFVSRRTGADRQLSEDIVQETYLRALSSWRRRGVAGEPIAWLKTVARNLLISHYRKQRPVVVSDLEGLTAGRTVRSPEAAALVHWALDRVKREQARLLEVPFRRKTGQGAGS